MKHVPAIRSWDSVARFRSCRNRLALLVFSRFKRRLLDDLRKPFRYNKPDFRSGSAMTTDTGTPHAARARCRKELPRLKNEAFAPGSAIDGEPYSVRMCHDH